MKYSNKKSENQHVEELQADLLHCEVTWNRLSCVLNREKGHRPKQPDMMWTRRTGPRAPSLYDSQHKPLAWRRTKSPRCSVNRPLSIRAYNSDAMMVAAGTTSGEMLEDAIEGFLSDPNASYLHIHNAGPGCYNCSVWRA